MLLLLCLLVSLTGLSQQDDAWFYLRARTTSFVPSFDENGGTLHYKGDDSVLREVLASYKVYQFKKTYRNSKKNELKRTFFVRCNDATLMGELLDKASHLFYFGEHILEDDKKIFEPNDYGLTSTIGDNLGAQVNLDYLDFLGVPKAWYYTTGNPDIVVGISDAFVDTADIEFKGRIKKYKDSPMVKGHGLGVAETAVGAGDNAFGVAGLCYNCNIASTSHGDFKNVAQLLELSRAGAKVINCSWGGSTTYYQTAQDAINEMYENGTIIVATGGNMSYPKHKGRRFNYLASYDKVIAISSAMHRYEEYTENIQKSINKQGEVNYYAENIRGFVGRTAGFRNNDTLTAPYIYPASVRNLNTEIDILGPSVGIFRYGKLFLKDEIEMSTGSATSAVAPLITGTIGLMFSLYPCLPVDEVEGILKMTSWNIDHIPQNKPYAGMYGSGILQTGDAVEMVYQLYNENEIAYIKNQNFSRWDFKLTALSKELRINNQKFTDKATLHITAKQRIVLSENTHLKPNSQGSIKLTIDPSVKKECDLVLRDPGILEN
ncbi:MAG: S8 family serine peptidase [Bacteroidetes bacterium]|nr:S8 family serine peptidase [Bacteroidota bacterium]